MLVGVPKEIKVHEYRVGLTPASVREFVSHDHVVIAESTCGGGIGASDDDYRAAGAAIVADPADIFSRAEMIVKVLGVDDRGRIKLSRRAALDVDPAVVEG